MGSDLTTQALLTRRGSLKEWLQGVSAQTCEIAIAVGFLSPEGLSTLLEVLRPRLGQIEKIRIVAGKLEPALDSHKVQNLRSLRDELRAKLEIRLRTQQNGIFHPKVYLTRGDAGWRGSLGSSNLTFSALYNNIEADVTVDIGDGGEFLRVFDEWWGDATPVDPEEWPGFPSLEALLNAAMQNGALVRVETYLEKGTVRLRVGDQSDTFRGDLLKLRESLSGSFPIVDPSAIRDLNNVVNRIRQKIREFSLKSPWEARFVPHGNRFRLLDLLANEEDVLRRAVRNAQEDVISEDEFSQKLEQDAENAAKKLRAADVPSVKNQLIEKAKADYAAFVKQCPRPLDAWVEVLPAPSLDLLGGKGPLELRKRIDATLERQWHEWLISLADVPRRSFLKYGNRGRENRDGLLPRVDNRRYDERKGQPNVELCALHHRFSRALRPSARDLRTSCTQTGRGGHTPPRSRDGSHCRTYGANEGAGFRKEC